jgi:structural maintenance of chromosome 4
VLRFLKATKLGRVTCIILDKIHDFRKGMEWPWNPLPHTTRLFDVVKPAMEEVRIAFYYALTDTIFCEDSQLGMDYAMKDDRNRRRVISRKQGGGYILYELNGLINGCLPKSGGFAVKAKTKVRQH